jgi:hypothetical protein
VSISKINGVATDDVVKVDGVAKADIAKIDGVAFPTAGLSIITTNLVQHLDAGDTSSYPGSGSTWFDLTTNNVDGTFRGAPTHSSTDGGGSFFFDGVDDGIKFDYDIAAPIRLGEDSGEVNHIGSGPSRTYGDLDDDGGFTVQSWVKVLSNGTSPTCFPFMPFGNNNSVTTTEASSNRWKYYQGIEITLTNNSNIIAFVFAGNGGNASTNRRDRRTGNGELAAYLDNWVNIAVTINDDTGSTLDNNIKIYIQGVGVSTLRSWSAYNEGTGPGLGYRAKFSSSQAAKYHAGVALRRGGFLKGHLSKQMVYNDVLTASEVLQNFNATKARYGY